MAVISRDDAADEERWIRYGSAPLIATLVLPIIIGIILVLKCVFNHCCVRKTTTKDEMYGLEGRMTMLSTADSNFVPLPSSSSSATDGPNHRPVSPVRAVGSKKEVGDASRSYHLVSAETQSKCAPGKLGLGATLSNSSNAHAHNEPTESSTSSSVCEIDGRNPLEYRRSSGGSRLTSSQDSTDLAGSLKRASAQHRQLPELPHTPSAVATSHPPRRSSSVLSHDGTSELYATVGETPLPDSSSTSKRSSHYAQIRDKNPSAGVSQTPSGFSNGMAPGTSSAGGVAGRARGIEATPSSDSETYASSSAHHPYAKLKKNVAEHPYARVRAAGANNDEETDTDNYDLPQFLSNSRQGPSSSGNATSSSSPPTHSSSGANQNAGSSVGVGSSADAEGPVPPRRIGRQWRRGSQPQVLNNDNASHFSGDSQDSQSRGYTSISVREPLSNIRSQVVTSTSRYDSHYATVSDDSEEMYAAIEDPSDSNYMRIPGDPDNNHPRRPTWLGGPNVSSPIPERREANSPLPPVPNVPPPDLSPGPSTVPPTVPPPSSPNSQMQPPLQLQSSTLPVYAQVTKKSKKQQSKTPVTPTTSNASISSQQTVREAAVVPPLPADVPFTITKESYGTAPPSHHSHHQSHAHGPHHRSKRAASLMDNSNPMDADAVDSRRWSKADISYSEFDVVRENMFPGPSGHQATLDDRPLPIRSPGSIRSDGLGPGHGHGRIETSPTIAPPPPRQRELVDEDNYNIIPEKSTGRGNTSAAASAARRRLDSGNYHEIEPRNLNNTYQEIGGGKEPSDHYQEIGEHRRMHDDDGGDLYQEIERKGRNTDEEEDEDEDEEDQFYERVKKPGIPGKGKKHGYEKIKKKGEPSSSTTSGERKRVPGNLSGVIPAIGSDEEDDDDERSDEMYESVKYPPYERLKESKDDLLDSEDGRNGSDYYEDIGYTRVKAKSKSCKTPKTPSSKEGSPAQQSKHEDDSCRSDNQDVSQLYAQVDKTKKRKGSAATTSTSTATSATTLPLNPTAVIFSNTSAENSVVQDISGNNNDPFVTLKPASAIMSDQQHLYSKVTKKTKTNRNADHAFSNRSGSANAGGGDDPRITNDNDNSIEYI